MEGLLIFIAIVVIDAVIKGYAKKRKQQPQLPRQDYTRPEQDDDEDTAHQSAPRNLQELIRQFQEAQREASQGTYVPPDPPMEEGVEEEDVDEEAEEEEEDLPVVQPARPGHFSFMEIAESVIQWEEVSVDYLQEAFDFSEATATKVLAELQKHKIVGRDMGDGFCDILVHDKVELANLFKREQAKANTAATAIKDVSAELERQRELNKLEARAREARENARTPSEIVDNGSSGEADLSSVNKPHIHLSRNIEDIRRGFIWAKVIDEPRFKKRWSASAR